MLLGHQCHFVEGEQTSAEGDRKEAKTWWWRHRGEQKCYIHINSTQISLVIDRNERGSRPARDQRETVVLLTFQGKCAARYSKVRCVTCTSGEFSFHGRACVKSVFGLERLLSRIDPVSSFGPLLSLTHMSAYRALGWVMGWSSTVKTISFPSDFDVSAMQMYSSWFKTYCSLLKNVANVVPLRYKINVASFTLLTWAQARSRQMCLCVCARHTIAC